MRLEQNVSCICYQDRKGNLLAGLGNKLVRIRSKVLARAPNELTEAVKAEYCHFSFEGNLEGSASVEELDSKPQSKDDSAKVSAAREAKTTSATSKHVDASDPFDSEAEHEGYETDNVGATSSADEEDPARLNVYEANDDLMKDDNLDDSIANIDLTLEDELTVDFVREPTADKQTKKTKKRLKTKKKRKGTYNIIDGGRIDPAVQVGLLELKVSEQNTKRLMKKAGIEY